ncbi:MAG: DNA-directed RNA polymerase subunit beta' [Planctomycetota bacterium]
MVEQAYEKINDYSAVKITLASPNDIRSWSYGEVKKPETINYRTYRAEKDGLFCERIFGPERDWECFCGKYKGMKHKGIICDRCGVKITHSRVRRKRMGHINLAAPVVHIWFFKSMPSRLSNLLNVKTSSLERVVYFQDYIVIDPGETPLAQSQLLTEEDYRRYRERYGHAFKAGMGAEAVKELLQRMDLAKLSTQLRADLKATSSKQKIKDLTKRLKIVEDLRDSDNDPSWMVLDVIPVIPPDLRPLVLLESGNFATSDLNDLYRRIINRNNRLKKLMELNAPEVIIRNEKRMLQQSVDALFDNNRCKRPVLGSSNRPLKSLTDMIKGKQGRFRENLLGKRVDYSARSVIVVGPELRLHQCGLPKKIALELFQPFIIRRLKELGYADTIKSAKKMLERKDEEVWDILEDVIQHHPVLLNRAPTLHRMGIQAFEPILIEGNAIKIHPLVCTGFNADFDGDQMAVHLPLSIEAQVEATTLMLSTNNVFSPANGEPIMGASQDMVLGISYLTLELSEQRGEGMRFHSPQEAMLAYAHGKIALQAAIHVRLGTDRPVISEDGRIDPETGPGGKPSVPGGKPKPTTVGRVIFNDVLPKGMRFYNYGLFSKAINQVIADCHKFLGREETVRLLDDIKEIGFKQATLAGLSFSLDDLRIPARKKEILEKTEKVVERIQQQCDANAITPDERYNQIIDEWTHARELVGKEMMNELKNDRRDGKPYLNPIYLMATSGARGNIDQIRQLAGMRGLMAKPSGEIIEQPIKANFREGLHVLEYFTSTHGARKGLADTALKTADSGYLTRKLADVAQNMVITMHDCGTTKGIGKTTLYKGEGIEVPLSRMIRGRVARDNIVNPVTDEVIVRENELITDDIARKIEEQGTGFETIRVRSVLECEAAIGCCALCYGMDLSTGKLVEEGMAVGIIAAQSIGEPGTQLTMRTFHIGGTASRAVELSNHKARQGGKVGFRNLRIVRDTKGRNLVVNRTGYVLVLDEKSRELDAYSVPAGAVIHFNENDACKPGDELARWDPHMVPIISELGGVVRFEDVTRNATLREELDGRGAVARRVIMEYKGDLHPQVIITDEAGKIVAVYPLPEKASIEVEEEQKVSAGQILARTPRGVSGTQDITGGLPRVTELFEARRPKDPAVMSEIDGVVELLDEKRRGKRTIVVRGESGVAREHLVPPGKHVIVHRGETVKAGDALTEGPRIPQDILRINGAAELQDYLLQEVQNVYRSQNVTIDDKHIEIIVGQMMRKILVKDPGDTTLLPTEMVDRFHFRRMNETVREESKKEATFEPLLLGITKASLQSESFISAASFQETTRVLTGAALAGRVDRLMGLKENVILGHLIPAGTGFQKHNLAELEKSEELTSAERKRREERRAPAKAPEEQEPESKEAEKLPA